MKTSDLISERTRLLPNLEAVRERLRTESPATLLQSMFGDTMAASRGLESVSGGEEGVGDGLLTDTDLPQNTLVENALAAQREATLQAGARAIEKMLDQGDNADLAPDEANGLEAIILLFGRPAILIQDGKFFPPPADWTVLESQRDAIQRTFQSVGRIEVQGHPRLDWIGTGFLVAKDVIMTNRHVAAEFTAPRGNGRWGIMPNVTARIDYVEELGATTTAEFALKSLIGIHPRFDMALFRVARKGGVDGKLSAPAPLPLAGQPSGEAPLDGRTVYVVGYPAWDGRRNDPEPMQRLFGNIYNIKRLQPGTVMRHQPGAGLFTHDCSTLGGNSGSCVVDLETHQVIGLHFGGRYGQANQSVALWELADDPLIKRAGITFV